MFGREKNGDTRGYFFMPFTSLNGIIYLCNQKLNFVGRRYNHMLETHIRVYIAVVLR